MVNISFRFLHKDELSQLIEFDKSYLQAIMMNEMGVSIHELPPALSYEVLEDSLAKGDDISWIYFKNKLAGYFWLERRANCLFIGGIALKQEYYGLGICEYVLNLAETVAKKNNLMSCALACLPLNGRAINAYFKQGYRIIKCVPAFWGPQYPDTFRFIMEKKLDQPSTEQACIDTHEIECVDKSALINASDNGYIGVKLIRGENNFKNKIVFKKY